MMEKPSHRQRKFIRHCAELAIDVCMGDVVPHQQEYLNDISLGGLSFKSLNPMGKGTLVDIRIPLSRPVFTARGQVVWCRKNEARFDIGVEFVGDRDPFKIRMVQQICHIENYKKEILRSEGRTLTGEQAALEWIRKFAHAFPKEHDQQ